MAVNTNHDNNSGKEHANQGKHGNFSAAVDFIGQPTAYGTNAGADERAKKCTVSERNFREFFIYQEAQSDGETDEGTEAAGINPGHEPSVFISENTHHGSGTLFW